MSDNDEALEDQMFKVFGGQSVYLRPDGDNPTCIVCASVMYSQGMYDHYRGGKHFGCPGFRNVELQNAPDRMTEWEVWVIKMQKEHGYAPSE